MHKLRQLPAYVKHLLVCANLFSAGNCVYMAFLVVYLVEILKLPAWQTAVIMSTSPITSKVMKLFIGFIADRAGYRYTIGIGFLFSCLGFIGYASTQNFYLLVLAAFSDGFGYSLYGPAIEALFSKLPENQRVIAYPYYLQSLNFGAIFGIGLGMAFLLIDEVKDLSPLWFGSIFFVILVIYFWLFVRQLPPSEYSEKVFYSIQRMFRNRLFVLFLIINFFYWIIYVQLSVSMPLHAFHITHNQAWSGSIVLIDSIYGFFLVIVFRSVYEKYSATWVYLVGLAIICLSYFMVPVYDHIAWLLFSLLFFAIGETLSLPAIDLIVAKCSGQKDSNAFFSIYAFASAIGKSLGSSIGVFLMESYTGTYVPWWIYSGIGVVGALLFFWIWRREEAASGVEQSEQVNL